MKYAKDIIDEIEKRGPINVGPNTYADKNDDWENYLRGNVMSKEYYANLYDARMNYLVNKFKTDPDDMDGTAASYEFDKTATVEEWVGFYVLNEGDNALKQWYENTEGVELSKNDKKIQAILETLYKK